MVKGRQKTFAKKAVSCSGTRMTRVSKSFRGLVLGGVLLVGGPLVESLSAQDAPYSGALETAFEWQYSCTNGKGCSFNCPGSGGASNVTQLTMHLGTIPLRDNQRAFGVFYEFSTKDIPRANGFSISTGISTLSCQVNGMDLDYSGPPSKASSKPPNKRPAEAVGPISRIEGGPATVEQK
jgi:hypothetical protein